MDHFVNHVPPRAMVLAAQHVTIQLTKIQLQLLPLVRLAQTYTQVLVVKSVPTLLHVENVNRMNTCLLVINVVRAVIFIQPVQNAQIKNARDANRAIS